jgi:hypothetical protein
VAVHRGRLLFREVGLDGREQPLEVLGAHPLTAPASGQPPVPAASPPPSCSSSYSPYWLTTPSPWPGPRPGRSLGGPVRPRPPVTPTWQARRRRGRRRPGSGIAGGKHNERRCAGGQLPFGPPPLHHGSGDSSAYSPSSGYLPRRTCPYQNHIEDVFTGHGTLHARYGGRFLIPGGGQGPDHGRSLGTDRSGPGPARPIR